MNLATKSRILVVDDDPAMRDMVATHLTRHGYPVATCASAAEALAVPTESIDVVVTDMRMPGQDGLVLCRALQARMHAVPVILTTAFGSMDIAIAALRAGAFDFLPKPFRIDALIEVIERAHGHRERRLAPTATLSGESAEMTELRTRVARLGASEAPVLVRGESGTGKELVVRALHAASPRAAGPLIAVNCAAMPAPLLESELFGHARGSFTGAHGDALGLFAAARGGTLFLDELGEMPLELQPKLLRALQERAVRPVGASAEVPVDVRVIAATHRDLEALVAAGTFREDLYFRVHVLTITVPPLRARRGDAIVLAKHFTTKPLAPAVEALFDAYPWPGNVRELESAIAHATALATGDQIELVDLPDRLRSWNAKLPSSVDPLCSLAELERRHVARVLDRVAGNKAAAARILGIERKTLYRMLDRWSALGGKQHDKAGATTEGAGDLDRSAVVLDDAVADRQPQPGAFADILRGEERIEDPR
ncbi:MAG: sigma-54 dependent transcriptional regulator [Kofleriaceae bacterium]